jgi:hypothetical protein
MAMAAPEVKQPGAAAKHQRSPPPPTAAVFQVLLAAAWRQLRAGPTAMKAGGVPARLSRPGWGRTAAEAGMQ